jgi:phage minor structural protein
MNVLGQASTELPKGLYISDDLKTEEVEAGVATLEFTLNYTASTRNDAKQYGSVGNYILRKNGDEQEFYTIITSEENIFKQEVEIYAEDAGMDLLNETVGEYKADKAYPASYYVEKFSDDSGFEIGINEVSNYNRKLSWEGETTASERILSVATQFDAEVSYTFEIDRLKIKHKYINLHKKRGVDQGRELRINREVKNIIVKSSVEDLATALSVTGGYPEDSETPINLKGYKYDDGDIYLSGSTIYSRSAVAKWSRYLSEKGNGTGHIVQTYTYDTLSQSELCNRAVSKLKKIYDAAVSYEVELAYLPDGIKIGDTVNIVDDAGELYLSARIMKLESSICNDEYTATLGEYKLKSSGISEKMESLASQFEKLAKNRTFYTWVVFADTETGAGISLKSAGKAYMGIAYNQTTKQPVLTDPSVYTWVKVVGDQGIAGKDGKDGATTYFHVKYSAVSNPTSSSQISETPNTYIGTYVDFISEDSTDPKKYKWYRFQGLQGKQGEKGIPGENGANGETSYLHIKYSDDGGKTFTSKNGETMGAYIGTCVDFKVDDPTTVKSYSWARIRGDQGPQGLQGVQGEQGKQGIQGEPGKDGKTTYFHIKYSSVANPTASSQMSEIADTYIGTYTDFTEADSTDPKKYTWHRLEGIQGEQGKQGIQGSTGADGKTSYLHIKYSNDAGKTFTGNEGEDSGEYIGTYVDFNKNDPTTVTAYKWSKMKGEVGATGAAGKDGIVISITGSNGFTFKNSRGSTALTAHVFKGGVEQEITDGGICGSLGIIRWYVGTSTTAKATARSITVTADDITNIGSYTCQLE